LSAPAPGTAPYFLRVAAATLALLAIVTVAAVVFASMNAKPRTKLTIAETLATLVPTERFALERLCISAGIASESLSAIDVWQLELGANPLALSVERGHVRALRISGTPLADMSAVAAFEELESLWFDRNKIVELNGTGGLSKLRELNLRENQLTTIARGRLPKTLVILDVGHNQLTAIEGIASAQALMRLFAAHNALTATEPLLGCPYLAEVDLDHNKVTSIDALVGLKFLRRVYVRGNPVQQVPEQLRNRSKVEVHIGPVQ